MSGARILVVEDEEELNEMLSYNLRKEGYDVQQCYDGAQAIGVIRRDRPNLVLLDIMLPGQDGWAVCRALEADPALSDVAVVVFTAKGTREDFDLANSFPNVRGYFVKPYGTADVLRHIERVLQLQRST